MIMDISTTSGRIRAWLDMHLVDHGAVRAVYSNFYDLGGGMYRSSQPSPAQLRKYQQSLGLRSVINLRGAHGYGSYALEKGACDTLGLMLHDIKLYSRTPPEIEEVHAMDELFKRLEYPALLHCKSGADRAGLGAALEPSGLPSAAGTGPATAVPGAVRAGAVPCHADELRAIVGKVGGAPLL